MKIKILTILVILTALFSFSCVNQEGLKPIQPNEIQTYKSVGIIKSLDVENNRLTIDHEDIPGYMSAMQMTESVKDKKMLENLKIGDKVDFELERTGSKIIISKLTKIGETAVLSGAEIYKTNCAECHAEKGEGSKKGISLITGHALHHSETEHIKQVTNGEGKKMPAFKDRLSASEIKSVVEFVRYDLQKNAVRDDSRKHQH